MVHLLVKLLVLLFIMPYNIQGYCEEKHEVHVHNDLPQNTPQLEVHCASGDDDLGYRYPEIGAEFNWSFCPTFSTLYFCHFWWNGKDLAFDVFNDTDACVRNRGRGFIPYDTTDCHWQVKDDGFYIGYFNQNAGQAGYCGRQVHILNNLPVTSPQLEFHCASGDDDLGHNFPVVGTDFHWKFCATKYTLFFCHFWWRQNNNQVFDVFNDLHYCIHDGNGYVQEYTSECMWKVQADGFYLGYFNQDVGKVLYTKYRDW
ncbi:hypothetical protein R3W88_025700 [Solanum pinnatisectum]|uniref:S-protein homolog n=1 Tax=Solanum pinnatisectum TaxID=50273 RepID=A0AAV9M4F7_9SOLN|nr:hypothetical protein R3W88_025700 [Solanum pinnatisectum]